MPKIEVSLPRGGKRIFDGVKFIRTSDDNDLLLSGAEDGRGDVIAIFARGAWTSAVKLPDEEGRDVSDEKSVDPRDRSTRDRRISHATREMVNEAQRALDKHGPENTMDAASKTDGDRLAILVEEVGEVAHELTYDQGGDRIVNIPGFRGPGADFETGDESNEWFLVPQNPFEHKIRNSDASDEVLAKYGYQRVTCADRLRKELVQVGAMAATWIALLDKED